MPIGSLPIDFNHVTQDTHRDKFSLGTLSSREVHDENSTPNNKRDPGDSETQKQVAENQQEDIFQKGERAHWKLKQMAGLRPYSDSALKLYGPQRSDFFTPNQYYYYFTPITYCYQSRGDHKVVSETINLQGSKLLWMLRIPYMLINNSYESEVSKYHSKLSWTHRKHSKNASMHEIRQAAEICHECHPTVCLAWGTVFCQDCTWTICIPHTKIYQITRFACPNLYMLNHISHNSAV